MTIWKYIGINSFIANFEVIKLIIILVRICNMVYLCLEEWSLNYALRNILDD